MKVVAYTALLYGVDYLEYAIRSVIDYVDEHHIIYSPIGAHGHRTEIPCPETRDELYEAALRGAGDKLRWHDAGPFLHEGYQRDSIHVYAPDADVILVVDADEIWGDGLASFAVSKAIVGELANRVRYPMNHYWRSFYRAVLHDPAYPERVIYPKNANRTITLMPSAMDGDTSTPLLISHLGYAQRSEIVRYKLETHGHRGEFRRDVDWFNDVFMANRQYDCHVVGSEYWNPEAVNPFDYGMPSFMVGHPYANLDVIP